MGRVPKYQKAEDIKCSRCGCDFNESAFVRDTRKPFGFKTLCKDCISIYKAEYNASRRKNNPKQKVRPSMTFAHDDKPKLVAPVARISKLQDEIPVSLSSSESNMFINQLACHAAGTEVVHWPTWIKTTPHRFTPEYLARSIIRLYIERGLFQDLGDDNIKYYKYDFLRKQHKVETT